MNAGDEEVDSTGAPVTRPHPRDARTPAAGTPDAVPVAPLDDRPHVAGYGADEDRPHLAHVKPNAAGAEMTSGHRKATKKPDPT